MSLVLSIPIFLAIPDWVEYRNRILKNLIIYNWLNVKGTFEGNIFVKMAVYESVTVDACDAEEKLRIEVEGRRTNLFFHSALILII